MAHLGDLAPMAGACLVARVCCRCLRGVRDRVQAGQQGYRDAETKESRDGERCENT
jgi:hypothetical protein